MITKDSDNVLVFVSAYASGDDAAIHSYRLDLRNGKMEHVHRTDSVEYPFFLALSANNRYLYSTHAPGGPASTINDEVAAFRITGDMGVLEILNSRSTLGTAAAYIDICPYGTAILVANYGSGSVASLPLEADGSLLEPSAHFEHFGSSVNKDRQSEPHAHCIQLSPDNRFAFAADLGTDEIVPYEFESEAACLSAGKRPSLSTRPGSGPRHLLFSRNGRFMYVVNELDSTIGVYDYLADSGALTERQIVTTLPQDHDGENHTADLKIAPDGSVLYATNRGHNSIAAFQARNTGELELIAIEPSLGEWPQNLAITACGSWLLCANMKSNCITVFRIDTINGRLTPVSEARGIHSPSCIKISNQ